MPDYDAKNTQRVENWEFSSMPRELSRECLVLTGMIWPRKESLDERLEITIAEDTKVGGIIWHLIRDGNDVIALSRSFPRVVADESGNRFQILALANVCTRPERRGQGLGQSVVEAAWSRLCPEYSVSFFQTPVPAFYEKLGARLVNNSIFNGSGDARAFWDPYAMIYPASAPWTEAKIDLLGPGW